MDRNCKSLSETAVLESIHQHYQKGIPWTSTALRDFFDKKTDQGGAWGYTSKDQFADRIKDIEALVETVEQQGYKSRRDLRAEGNSLTTNDPIPPIYDEVTVDIGRNGELLWRDFGMHRLAVAKLLGVDGIPVHIAAVHADY